MSKMAASRWYRAPELILLEANYDQLIDVWALGCITAEMIYCSKLYTQKADFHKSKRYLFKGDSCYPLSPRAGATNENQVSNADQIVKICKILPFHNQTQDLSFISSKLSMKYQLQICD